MCDLGFESKETMKEIETKTANKDLHRKKEFT